MGIYVTHTLLFRVVSQSHQFIWITINKATDAPPLPYLTVYLLSCSSSCKVGVKSHVLQQTHPSHYERSALSHHSSL